jgi:hypothetical protein
MFGYSTNPRTERLGRILDRANHAARVQVLRDACSDRASITSRRVARLWLDYRAIWRHERNSDSRRDSC